MKTYEEMFGGQFSVKPQAMNTQFVCSFDENLQNFSKVSKDNPKISDSFTVNKESDNEIYDNEVSDTKVPEDKCDDIEQSNSIQNEDEISVLTTPVTIEEHDIIAEKEPQENGLVIYDESDLKEVKKGFLGRLITKKRK